MQTRLNEIWLNSIKTIRRRRLDFPKKCKKVRGIVRIEQREWKTDRYTIILNSLISVVPVKHHQTAASNMINIVGNTYFFRHRWNSRTSGEPVRTSWSVTFWISSLIRGKKKKVQPGPLNSLGPRSTPRQAWLWHDRGNPTELMENMTDDTSHLDFPRLRACSITAHLRIQHLVLEKLPLPHIDVTYGSLMLQIQCYSMTENAYHGN